MGKSYGDASTVFGERVQVVGGQISERHSTDDEGSGLSSSANLITTTIVAPNLLDTAHQGLSITTLPSCLTADTDIQSLVDEFDSQILATLETPITLPPGVGALLEYDPHTHNYQSVQRQFSTLSDRWNNFSHTNLAKFCEYVVFGETVLIEESPPRRTSPAAIAASKIASRTFIAGEAGTSTIAVLAHSDNSVFIVVMGSGVTLVMATAGVGLVLASHWLSKKLNV